jgi:uncharacterized phiE125 gp8 family phage protein
MLTSDPIVASAESVDAAKTWLRLDSDADDPVLAALIVAATAQCEAFTGVAQIQRNFTETLDAGAAWTRLRGWPVVSIAGVSTSAGVPLPVDAYAVDIGTDGIGRVRLANAMSQRVSVAYRAGAAVGWSAIAEPVRQAIVELVAHRYEGRDRADGAGLPDGVVALWRAARRMVLS